MIQRKQSVFLLLSVILGVLTLSVQFYSWVMFVVLLLAASLNLYTIFLYLILSAALTNFSSAIIALRAMKLRMMQTAGNTSDQTKWKSEASETTCLL